MDFTTLIFRLLFFFNFLKCEEIFEEDEAIFMPLHSFRKPFLDSHMQIPHWIFKGDAMVTKDFIRLTPDKSSKRGSLWNYVANYARDWTVEFQFGVHGDSPRLFGDGFAFWYTKNIGNDGPAFGNEDKFSGLGVFFDTYNNQHSDMNQLAHPIVSVMINNGSLKYEHEKDGSDVILSSCQVNFRSSLNNGKAKITYKKRNLLIEIDGQGTGTWQLCFNQTDIDLPTYYYYGFTAITGGLSDNHDIFWMNTHIFPDKDGENKDYSNIIPRAGHQIVEEKTKIKNNNHGSSSTATRIAFYIGIIFAIIMAVVFVIRAKINERNLKRF